MVRLFRILFGALAFLAFLLVWCLRIALADDSHHARCDRRDPH